ncbi:MAG: chromate transporter [Prevotella sp.]|nr:chromate transporter [Prevotella sp.]
MIFLSLFITFFEIGLFGFGGGYGMLSLIQNEVVYNHNWMTIGEFTNIVAISQMTPGPIGINSATYCGYTAIKHAGMSNTMAIMGSATATTALVLPSFILMIIIAKLLLKYMKTPLVESIFMGLRPAVVGLLAAAALLLMKEENFGDINTSPWRFWISVGIFLATWIGTKVVKINPILMMGFAGFAGLLLLY